MRLLIISFLLLSQALANVVITGVITHYKTNNKLEGVQVSYRLEGSKAKNILVNTTGRYKFDLDTTGVYMVEYSKPGFYTKTLKINTTDIPERRWKKGLSMLVDMDMVEVIKGFDSKVFRDPVGIAFYDDGIEDMTWDVEYVRTRFNEIDNAFRHLEQDVSGVKTSEHLPVADSLLINYRTIQDIPHPFEAEYAKLSMNSPDVAQKKPFYLGQVGFYMLVFAENDQSGKAYMAAKNMNTIAKQIHPGSELDSAYAHLNANSTKDEFLSYYKSVNKAINESFDVNELRFFQLGTWTEYLYTGMTIYKINPKSCVNTIVCNEKLNAKMVNDHMQVKNEFLTDRMMGLHLQYEKINEAYKKLHEKKLEVIADENKSMSDFKITEEWTEEMLAVLTSIRKNMIS